ncbi:MAG: biotin--[Clostridia bacterium]|nr:biotin--[acetyl-CoA-carboxylase] ligase [Clostridia bacterium]
MTTFKITRFGEVTSTNDIAKNLAEDGAPEGTVIIADKQTKGRGRMGRSFLSPEGTGLYMSIILRPEFEAEC